MTGSRADKSVGKVKACNATLSPVDIGEYTGLLAPHRGGQDDIRELGGFILKDILSNDLKNATK
jgi:hypothetical protein